MKLLTFVTAALLCGGLAAHAQVQFSGPGTPGHAPAIVTNSVIKDGGPATAGQFTELGIHKNGGLPFCISDVNNPPPFQAPFAQFCLAITPSQAQLIVNSTGTSPPAFTFLINGTPFPIATGANAPFVDGFLNTIGTGNFSANGNVVFTAYSQKSDKGGGSFINIGTACTPESVTLFKDSAGNCFQRQYAGSLFSPWGNVQDSPTNAIDSTAAWKSVIAAATLNGPSVGAISNQSGIWCQDGSRSAISDQLFLPIGVGISGPPMEANSCEITVVASSPAIQASGAIHIGSATQIGAAQTVDNLVLNLNQQQGVGLYCQQCQDNSGFNRDFVYQTENGPGLWMDGNSGAAPLSSVNSFTVTHNNVWGAQGRTAGGFGMEFTNNEYPADINGNDVLCYQGHCWGTAVFFQNEINALSFNWTIEDNPPGTPDPGTTGIGYSGDAVITLIGATINSIADAVVLRPASPTPGAFNAFITGLFVDHGGVSIDNTSGLCGPAKTITDPRVSLFACGNIGYLDFNQVDVSGGTIINVNLLSPTMFVTDAAPARILANDASDNALLVMQPFTGSTAGANRDNIYMFDQGGVAGWQLTMQGDGANTWNWAGSATGAPVNRVQWNAATGDETLLTGSLTISTIASDTGLTTTAVCQQTSTHKFFSGSVSGACNTASSRRFKQEIQPMPPALGAVMALQPVTFRYRKGYGDNGVRRQSGLIAEDVVKLMPDCVGFDAAHRPMSVDYPCVAMHALKGEQELAMQVVQLRAEITRHHRRHYR